MTISLRVYKQPPSRSLVRLSSIDVNKSSIPFRVCISLFLTGALANMRYIFSKEAKRTGKSLWTTLRAFQHPRILTVFLIKCTLISFVTGLDINGLHQSSNSSVAPRKKRTAFETDVTIFDKIPVEIIPSSHHWLDEFNSDV